MVKPTQDKSCQDGSKVLAAEGEGGGGSESEIDPVRITEEETEQPWFHAGQRELWRASESTLIALCGTQGGKTAMLPWWLMRETIRASKFIVDDPLRGNAILAGPSLTLLQAQAIPALKQVWCDEMKLGRWVDTPKPRLIVSPEGAFRLVGKRVPITIRCAYASDPNNLESMTAYAAVWDEGGQIDNKEVSYEAIRRRLMAATKANLGRLLITTTPYEWNWLKHRLVDRADTDSRIRVVNWPSWLNPSVSEADCRRELEAGMPLWRWRMMYEGRYERPAGLIYDCFERDVNTCARFTIPAHWRLIQGVDFGPENTAAVTLAEERASGPHGIDEVTGRYYVISTYHAGDKKTTYEHVAALKALACSAVGGAPLSPFGYGGSSTESGWRDAWSMAGLPLGEPSESDVELQIQMVWSAFKKGRLVVFDDLSSLLREIDTYSRELDANGERTDRIARKSSFHRLDALRYAAPALFGLPLSRRSVEVYRRR